ncbi:unnamed protein product [Prorocentrum cordatum]|uniref:Uncharacterized protein n=1 Tax=Prorocentrum cordatum TaxID=2364126 RepID=A0ABN9RV59_9DINO|nr:unnamed protein product [Polarella glacialis]
MMVRLQLLLSFCRCHVGYGTTAGRTGPTQSGTNTGDSPLIEAIASGTETMSLEEALRVLGYRLCHMEDLIKDLSHPAAWCSFADGHSTAEALFHNVTEEGYNATMDNSMCDVYADQLRIFLDARVVHTQHPKENAG